MRNLDTTACRAFAKFALVAAASAAAASLWAQVRPETGLLVDARTWQEEVVTADTGPWPEDGWYRIVQQDGAVEVRAVKPTQPAAMAAADALYFRQPGTALKEGERRAYRYPEVLQQPRLGTDYELSLGKTRFSVRVEEASDGFRYHIGYGGETYTYLLGPARADHTVVRGIADIDGDSQPDFVVDVDDSVYLLLSTQARPGMNAPSAHFTEQGS